MTIVLSVLLLSALIWSAYIALRVTAASQKSRTLVARTTPYEQHPKGANMHILVAGDSTAYGTGAGKGEGSIAGRLGSDFPGADITNISVNGLRVGGLEKLLRERIATQSQRYDIIVLQIGANDVTGLTSRSNLEKSLASLLGIASLRAGHVFVLTAGDVGLSPVFLAPLSTLLSHRSRSVRSVFMEEIAHFPNTAYVDLLRSKEDEPFNKDIPRFYAADGFHPSAEGYALWYEQLRITMSSSGL